MSRHHEEGVADVRAEPGDDELAVGPPVVDREGPGYEVVLVMAEEVLEAGLVLDRHHGSVRPVQGCEPGEEALGALTAIVGRAGVLKHTDSQGDVEWACLSAELVHRPGEYADVDRPSAPSRCDGSAIADALQRHD